MQRWSLNLACDVILTRQCSLWHRAHRLLKTARPARPSVTSVANRKRRCWDRIVCENLSTFLAEAAYRYPSGDLPAFFSQEFERYLRCGILRHGFARVRCLSCRDEILVAFSCKNRGVCPSCCARRMADSAAHLRDCVFPSIPVRQWAFRIPANFSRLAEQSANLAVLSR